MTWDNHHFIATQILTVFCLKPLLMLQIDLHWQPPPFHLFTTAWSSRHKGHGHHAVKKLQVLQWMPNHWRVKKVNGSYLIMMNVFLFSCQGYDERRKEGSFINIFVEKLFIPSGTSSVWNITTNLITNNSDYVFLFSRFCLFVWFAGLILGLVLGW